MEIVKYKIKNKGLTVGFKEDNFVVYSLISIDDSLTQKQLIQKAYEQVKKNIDYERTLTEHSLICEEHGEEFIPESPKLKRLKLQVDSNTIVVPVEGITKELSTSAYDQYGDNINAELVYSQDKIVEGVSLEGNKLIVSNLANDETINITVSCGDISDSVDLYLISAQ